MNREKEHIIADKTMLQVARVTSMVFTPFSIPFLSFLVLFLFSYLRIMPMVYKLIVLGIVYCFTILTPTITIFLFRKINGFARQELGERKKRFVPILLTIISYVFCLLMMRRLNLLPGTKVIPFSSVTKQGRDEIWDLAEREYLFPERFLEDETKE